MKKYEDMTEDERNQFFEDIIVDIDGDGYINTPTFDEFECAVLCMGFDSVNQFQQDCGVIFEELKDRSWLLIGSRDGNRIYVR